MRVCSAAPARAPLRLTCVVALAAAACTHATNGGTAGTGGGTSGQAGTGGASGSGGTDAGGGAGSAARGGAGGVSAPRGGAGGAAVAGTGGGATGGMAGASGGGASGSGGGAGTSGTSGGGGTGGGAGTVAVVIPGAGNCTPPAGANPASARAAYMKWYTDLVTSDGAGGFLRVRRPNSSSAVVNSTVSEGIAYGMLLSVYADDQPTFDKLWQYSQLHLGTNKLMDWYIGPSGELLGSGGASDADEDM